jgi:hypothetical protein
MKRRSGLVLPFVLAVFAAAPPLAAEEPAKSPETQAKASAQPPRKPLIFASPIHGGCYIAAPGQCKIHVEPFTIDIASGKKLVFFQLVSIQLPSGIQRVIYDWRPDQSNPLPYSGTTVTPSLVTQDFAATCGNNYEISLQGKDSGDTSAFNLGLTGQFTCPSTAP